MFVVSQSVLGDELFVDFRAFSQLAAVALLGQLQRCRTGLGDQELLVDCAEIVGLALYLDAPLFFSYFCLARQANQVESAVLPLFPGVQKTSRKQVDDLWRILSFLLADFVLVYLSQLALAHQESQHLLFSDLQSIQSIAVVESEVLDKTTIFRQQKPYQTCQSFWSQQFRKMRHCCSLFYLSALASLLPSEQPHNKSLNDWYQSTLSSAFAQRPVKFLLAAAQSRIGLQDDRPVVEKLQTAAVVVCFWAKSQDVGQWMQVPKSEEELCAHSHLGVVFEVLEKQVAFADCSPH